MDDMDNEVENNALTGLANRLQYRVTRQRELLTQLNALVGAVEAMTELASPTGALSAEICFDLLEAHFSQSFTNLLGEAVGNLSA